MFGANILALGFLVLVPVLVLGNEVRLVNMTESLKTFMGSLERYANTENDVVFLLDESGSITIQRFPEVKLFARLMSHRLSVAAEHSRVAVVTFSDKNRRHVNYIEKPYGNNMCSLLVAMDKIDYNPGGTHTHEAMVEAEKILVQSRPSANRIIVLLTDGESNDGHSPISIANRLKQAGIIIFAVGVAKVNVAEINAVATALDHTYILDDFKYIVEINKYLVNDTKEIKMDPATNSYCDALCTDKKDCCDMRASCYCGTRTGKYECACQAGYYGNSGLKTHCKKCPRGTFKSEALNRNCTQCPPHATTEKEGSTSFLDCKCETGYEKIGKYCLPVRCASLSVPDGGILIPTHCNNTFGTQCQLKCKEGYCPFSCNNLNDFKTTNQVEALPTRTCLESKDWSSQEFHCEKRTCPALRYPPNGKHNCSENDFTFGTVCSFYCNKGFELFGSEFRTCMINSWTGNEVTCKEKFCDPLKTNDLLHVKRTPCSTNPMPYRSVCQYHCSNGYILVRQGNKTDGVLTCGDNRKWIGGYDDITCQDNEPPKIICPNSIKIDAEFHKGYQHVKWNYPNATDNIPGTVTSVQIIEPKRLKKSPYFQKGTPAYLFPIGRTKVVYEATDRAKLTKTCSFSVEVLDKEPPMSVYCPDDIEIFHNTNDPIPVEWKEPIFEDNSKKLSVECSRKSGDGFGWGTAVAVSCNATDESNNTAVCNFNVKVKHYPCPFYDPPANGVVTCDTWIDGRMCSVFCHEGYQFATGNKFERNYFCKQTQRSDGKIEGQWKLLKGLKAAKMPWPDCSKIQRPTAIRTSVDIQIPVDSCSEESLEKFREKFFNIQAFKTEFFCPKDKGCKPENINITCNPVSTRNTRSIRMDAPNKNRRHLPVQVLTINFNVKISPPNTTGGNIPTIKTNEADGESKIDLSSNPFIKELENEIIHNVKDAYNVSNHAEPKMVYNAVVICSVGQIRVNNTCVNCPAGTYKDDVSETCIVCPSATFQDEERQLSCKPCPVGFTTHEVKSKSPNDCKGPCQPGTYSESTFEPCFACPLNTYQERAGRKDCLKCPQGLYTWRVGADASSNCVAPCKPGTFSDTGYEPCSLCGIGTFQDQAMQTNCTICPDRTTTQYQGAKHLEDCKEFDICTELNPCHYNSTCIQQDKDYECQCPEGLRGRNCENNVDDCVSDPCLNNGTCIDGVRNFTCICPEGWTGHQCEINIDDCVPNLCLNGGKCVDKVNSFNCECLDGFSGLLCERNIYECESNPCQNGGTCFDKQNGYRCCCPKDFHGLHCETEVRTNACNDVICQNGGTCSGDKDAFNCTCPSGFEGILCETDVDDCQHHQCVNGGVCVDGVGNATCTCPDRYAGPRCEDALLLDYTLSFPTASTTNYVALNNARRLYSITVAFFMRTSFKDPNSRATPISYSYKHKDHVVDNALTLLDTNNFVLYLHGEALYTHFSANSDSSWHHYAVTWEKHGGKWGFFVDGKSVASGQDVGERKYMHPGTFVLGQEQDDIGSMFSMLEAFVGDITEFNVWDYAMTSDEISEISAFCGSVGNVIPWYTVSQYAKGDVKIHENPDICTTMGHCLSDECNCLKSDTIEEVPCKNQVTACTTNTCANDQPCSTVGELSFCDCGTGFEGRRCEYDIDECLDQNGGCDFLCVNDVGTGSYHCECPDDMVLSEDGKTCKDIGYCVVKGGQTYMSGETWISDCQNCVCDKGIVKCTDIVCNKTECQPEETLIINPGECCPKCVAWSFCVISPTSTIMSFDLSKYQIEGGCNYTALEDCIDGRFKVQLEFITNETILKVHQDCSKLTISSDGSMFIDDGEIEPPFNNSLWNVERANTSVVVKTNSDLILEWDTQNDVVIAVPVTHQSKMCGLCSKLEEYYVYDTGKFSLSDRWATGENVCYILSEGYQDVSPSRGTLAANSTAIMLLMCVLTLLITSTGSKLLP